jgi:hypothetical protein
MVVSISSAKIILKPVYDTMVAALRQCHSSQKSTKTQLQAGIPIHCLKLHTIRKATFLPDYHS